MSKSKSLCNNFYIYVNRINYNRNSTKDAVESKENRNNSDDIIVKEEENKGKLLENQPCIFFLNFLTKKKNKNIIKLISITLSKFVIGYSKAFIKFFFCHLEFLLIFNIHTHNSYCISS